MANEHPAAMRTYGRRAVVIGGTALLLVACSPGSPKVPAPEPAATGGSAATCVDSSDQRLTSAELSDTGGALRVSWATTGTEAAVETILWSATVQNADFTSAYQLGVNEIDGEVFVYVFDIIESTQVNLSPSEAEVSDGGATADFPWSNLGTLAEDDMQWRAALSMDGTDVAVCPAPGGDALSPAKADFARN